MKISGMKSSKIHIALLSTTLLTLNGVGCVLAAEAGAVQDRSIVADGATAKTLDESWRVAADARIEIGNVRGKVDVSGWDKAETSLSGSLGAGSKLEISGDAQHLVLRVEGSKSGWFGGNGPDRDSDLVLHVPHAAALKLDVVSADASVTGVAGKSLDVDGVSGKLNLSSGASEVDVNSVSGEVAFSASAPSAATRAHLQTVSSDIDAKGLGGRVKLETVSGNIGFDSAQVQELETGTVSGDARIQAAPAAHGRIQLESMSGNIRLRLPAVLSAHVEVQTFSGDISSDYGNVQNKERGPGSSLDARVGDGDAQIHVESFSGDIELRKQGG
jgi:hypothetical protein